MPPSDLSSNCQETAAHRVVDSLTESGYSGFEPRLQPACMVCSDMLQAYFAKHGGETVGAREHRRAVRRGGIGRPRISSFIVDWSPESANTTCMCNTHTESVSAVKKSNWSAGFLIAATDAGVTAGNKEIDDHGGNCP